MKRKRIAGLLAVIVCLLPLIAGMFGFGGTAQAAAPVDEQKVNVTLHKKKMDQFPTENVENTGEEMDEFKQYEGLPGVTFNAWDVSKDFYKQLNEDLDPHAEPEVYAEAVKTLMKTYKLNKNEASLIDTQETGPGGIANFKNLDKRSEDGTYKVYFFEEVKQDGVEASNTPLILVLPVVKDKVENRDIHLYPKNKVNSEVDKELVDENGNPLYDKEDPEAEKKNRYDYEVGKKIYYHASFTIPDQIGEILDEEGVQQTRYSQLQFKDAVNQIGVKFEGIQSISVGDEEPKVDIKSTFLPYAEVKYTNDKDDYDGYAGFDINMNLNASKSNEDLGKYTTSKETAEYLKKYAGKTLHIYYAVSLTDKTPVDTDVDNNFSVELTHDGVKEDEKNATSPSVTTGGKKFYKHESGKEDQALEGAKFVVIKKDGGKDYYLTYANNEVKWTLVGDPADYKDATPYVSAGGGHIQVSGLEYGEYFLREIEAPNGFQLLKEDKKFDVSKGSFADGETLDIANVSKGGFLPSTGGKGIIAFLAVGMALMLFAFYKYRRIQQAAN